MEFLVASLKILLRSTGFRFKNVAYAKARSKKIESLGSKTVLIFWFCAKDVQISSLFALFDVKIQTENALFCANSLRR